ncbi:hypothetical protein [Methylobacterium sp. J-077]|uniref:hypothetical protein n=1 Tax=Methylobacterium sp. J-077 TaxID=2836656 RepID=UPI001FB9C25D|nr:hypothetical protein [Methylobacterium sp. J-077]MCJ2121358.1 hypothetical protein [Methylobacterium sp. J-077]
MLEYIRLAEAGIEQGITLSVGGSLVTGTLVSGQKFFDLLGKEILDAKSKSIGDTQIYENLKSNYDYFGKMLSEVKDNPDDPVPLRNYVHLMSARMLFGNHSVPTSGGMLWRGKVQAVDAFFCGLITKG